MTISARTLLTTIAVSCALTASARAQDDAPVFSGPQAGEKLPPLRANLAYGERAGQSVDFIEEAGERPMLLVIVSGSNRPAANLTRCLMNFAEMHANQLFAGVVYLDSDRSAAESYLKQAVSWWGMGPPVGIAVDGAEGPGSYGLNRNVNLTILIADSGKVVANYALIQPSLTDAPKILADVVTLTGGRVPTEPELTFLSSPTRNLRGANWQAAPTDAKLRKLICDGIAAQDAEQANAAATAIEEYVLEDARLQQSLGSASEVLLRTNKYNVAIDTPIAAHLARWREQYDAPQSGR